MKKYNILLLANNRHITSAVIDHINAVTSSKEHQWFIENPLICKTLHKIDLNIFDAIGFHYSIRPYDPYYVPRNLYRKIKNYQGGKFIFLQDEYKHVNLTMQTLIDLDIHLLFTLVKPSLIEKVYNEPALTHTKKISILTGYTPKHLEFISSPPIKNRPIDIFYRGRVYDFWLGQLTQDRNKIANGILKFSPEYNLKVDISLIEEKRLYGAAWYDKHMQSKTVLGTESGASIWDFDGKIEKEVKQFIRKHPHLHFQAVYDQLLKKYDGNVMYNACSPRIFEAIALRTALIMFPGEYSGVCLPNKHYIPLEKDFSNINDVMQKLKDPDFLQNLVDSAHHDIIASGRYAQAELTKIVSQEISLLISNRPTQETLITPAQKSIEANELPEFTLTGEFSEAHQDTFLERYSLLNTYYIFLSELSFSLKNLFCILFDPQYRLSQKCSRLIKGIKRYFAYLIPRFKKANSPSI